MRSQVTPFVFDPQANGDTYADFERAIAEGWYGLEICAITEDSRKTCASKISECLNRAAELGETRFDPQEESPWSEPNSSIHALRMALRAIVASDNAITDTGYAAKRAREMNREALLAVSNALITIELPD